MPLAPSSGAKLYYEDTGTGYPVIFVHEFGGDHRSWETQVRFLSRRYRCITFNARGYPPSDVPDDDTLYGQDHATDDIAAVLRHLGVAKAHVVGLSMGALATLHFGLRHKAMASALVLAGCGAGAPRGDCSGFAAESEARARRFLEQGSPAVAEEMGRIPARITLKRKDPRGWQEHVRQLGEHDAKGSALTLRNYQAKRPSLYDLEGEIRRLDLPVLVAVGDEDPPCLEPSFWLKRVLPKAGLWVCPHTGHCMNLEEPASFNRALDEFFAAAEAGRWPPS
jgi:pimeloyl-ACP methyl ester carboxylesterase